MQPRDQDQWSHWSRLSCQYCQWQINVCGSDTNHLSTLFPVPAGQLFNMSLKQNESDLQIPLIHIEPGVACHLTNRTSSRNQHPVPSWCRPCSSYCLSFVSGGDSNHLYRFSLSLDIIQLEKYSKQKISITLLITVDYKGSSTGNCCWERTLGKEQGTFQRHTYYLRSSFQLRWYDNSQWVPAPHPRCHRCHPLRDSVHPGLLALLMTRNHDVNVLINFPTHQKCVEWWSQLRYKTWSKWVVRAPIFCRWTSCQPQAKITQQKKPPTERKRRMYSCAADLEVEDKTGRLQRLV
jgi:hypothetical protein